MKTLAPVQTTSVPSSSTGSNFFLQRKCACGGSAGLSGTCEECADKKLLKQPLQAKLVVGSPDDPLEEEAESVAERLGFESNSSDTVPVASLAFQRLSPPNALEAGSIPPSVDRALRSPGTVLASPVRQRMERGLGHNFSQVRIHTDARSTGELSALAYTVGSQVVFAPGQYAPQSPAGWKLLAHELTHVIQQGSGVGPSGVLQRATTRGAGGCATSLTDADEDDNGPLGAGRRAHDQIQAFLLPAVLSEQVIPRASKSRIDNTGCQAEGSTEGRADLFSRAGILMRIAEIKPIGSAPTRGVNEAEHYVRRSEQSVGRLYGGGSCGTPGADDLAFQSAQGMTAIPPTFAKLTGVLPNTTLIGKFIGDPSKQLKAKTVAPGAVGYWCTGGTSDTYTCGASPEQTAAFIDRVVGGPAQEVLDRFIRDGIQAPLEATLQRQSLGELIRLGERHFGGQLRELLRPYLGRVADRVLNHANADQLARLVDQAVGPEARNIVTTLVRLITDAFVSELRTLLRGLLSELVRDTLAALCVGAPAVALSDLLDRLRQTMRERSLQLIPVVATLVVARVIGGIATQLQGMLQRMTEALRSALHTLVDVMASIGEMVLRLLAALLIPLLIVGALVAAVIAVVLFLGSPGLPDEAIPAGLALAMLALIPTLSRFVASGSTAETPEGT